MSYNYNNTSDVVQVTISNITSVPIITKYNQPHLANSSSKYGNITPILISNPVKINNAIKGLIPIIKFIPTNSNTISNVTISIPSIIFPTSTISANITNTSTINNISKQFLTSIIIPSIKSYSDTTISIIPYKYYSKIPSLISISSKEGIKVQGIISSNTMVFANISNTLKLPFPSKYINKNITTLTKVAIFSRPVYVNGITINSIYKKPIANIISNKQFNAINSIATDKLINTDLGNTVTINIYKNNIPTIKKVSTINFTNSNIAISSLIKGITVNINSTLIPRSNYKYNLHAFTYVNSIIPITFKGIANIYLKSKITINTNTSLDSTRVYYFRPTTTIISTNSGYTTIKYNIPKNYINPAIVNRVGTLIPTTIANGLSEYWS